MKTFIITTTINIEIKAEDQEAAEAKFFDATINFKDPEGEELDWTFIDQDIQEYTHN